MVAAGFGAAGAGLGVHTAEFKCGGAVGSAAAFG